MLYIHSDVNARNCTNTRSAGVQLQRGHMILDNYVFFNLIKLQKMKRSITGKAFSSKNAKVSYDQVAIAASLP